MATREDPSVDSRSSSEDESAEATKHDDLPQGSERDLIEYYFYRGLMYRHITLMLEKQHNIIMKSANSKAKAERLWT